MFHDISRRVPRHKTPSRSWSYTDRKEIRKMWDANVSEEEMAKNFSVSVPMIKNQIALMRKEGFDLKPRKFAGKKPELARAFIRGDKRWSQADMENLIKMWKGAKPINEICVTLGRTKSAIKSQIKKLKTDFGIVVARETPKEDRYNPRLWDVESLKQLATEGTV